MARRKNLAPERSFNRNRPSREPRARYLIVCEGENTEPAYFRGYIRLMLRDSMMTIDVDDAQGNPLTLVQRAKKLKDAAIADARRQRDDNLSYDRVWAVTDVDQHPNLPEARIFAKKNSIGLAVSNPCIELWGALHFKDVTAHAMEAGLQDILAAHMPGYDRRRKLFEVDRMKGRFNSAKTRALALDKMHSRDGVPHDTNPSTDVHVLVQALIDEAAKVADPGPNACFGL